MRIKTTTSIDGVSKMAAFAAVSYPIFKYYGYGYANFSMLLMYIFFIYVLKKRGRICFLHSSLLLLYVCYYCVARFFFNSTISEIIDTSIIYICLFWGVLNKELDLNVFLKYYRVVAFVNIIFFIFQELMYMSFGYRIIGIFTFLPIEVKGIVGSYDSISDWADVAIERERSSAFFSEPAHLVQFLLPLVIAELFYVADKKAYIRSAIYLLTLLALASGNALLGVLVIIVFYMIMLLRRFRPIVAFFSVLVFSLMIIFSIRYVMNTEYGEKLLDRQAEIFQDGALRGQTMKMSGFIRIWRGYYILDTMSPFEILVGLHSKEKLEQKISQTSVAYTFGVNDTYMNAFQRIIIQTGLIDLFFYFLFLRSLWKGNNISGKCCITTYVALCFIASIYFTHVMVLFLVMALLMKKTKTSVAMKSFSFPKY